MTEEQMVKVLIDANQHFIEAWQQTQKPPSGPTWVEHFDLVQVSLVALIGYFVWSWKRILDKFESSLELLTRDHHVLKEKVVELSGHVHHQAIVCYGRRAGDKTAVELARDEE